MVNTNKNNITEERNLRLWNYSEYKRSLIYDNRHRKKEHKERVQRIKEDIKRMKERLKEIEENKPITIKPTQEGYKKCLLSQLETAKDFHAKPIYNNKIKEIIKDDI